jgi:membrane protein
MTIGGYRVGELLKKTAAESLEDRVPMLAASGAYYFFFSLFPLLLFLAPLLSFVGEKERLVTGLMERVSPVVPGDARAVIEGVLRDVVFIEGAPALMSVGALLAAFAASNVISMLTMSLNVAYDVSEPRSFWKRRLLALVFVILGGFAIALAIPVMLAGAEIIAWAGENFGLGQHTATVVTWLQYPITFAVMVAILWLVYFILPATKQNPKLVLVGALVAAALWVIVTLAFRFYVVNFAGYNRTYGTIGGIIILLMWMWLTMLVLLVGGELNSELHRGTGLVKARRPVLLDGRIPTTEEAPQPSAQLPQDPGGG